MKAWPSLRTVLVAWAVFTVFIGCAYVVYLRTLPPDELVMANTIGFQVMVTALVVGVPAFALLLLFLLVGAMLQAAFARW